MKTLRKIRMLPVCVCALCLAVCSMAIYDWDWWTPALVMVGSAWCLAYLDRTDREEERRTRR